MRVYSCISITLARYVAVRPHDLRGHIAHITPKDNSPPNFDGGRAVYSCNNTVRINRRFRAT
jgi:hypothetical protein